MARVGELDWTDLYEGRVGEPEDARSRPVEKDCHKGGERISEEDLKKDAEKILAGFNQAGVRSATKEEFEARLLQIYPELNKTDEEWDEVEKQWDNFFNNYFEAFKKPVDNKEVEWGTGKSFRDTLSKSEREQYERSVKKFDKEHAS